MAAMRVGPKVPFLMIVIGSAIVAAYAIYRAINPVRRYVDAEG